MSIAQAEKLKRDLTDKYVVVQDGIPELQRFSGLTGKVKTVNMSCRALVQFDGPVDIGWYDIDPSFLKVVAAPLPKAKSAEHAEKPPAAEKAEKPKPAAGKSPLELARQQGAAKAAEGTEGKKLSPLELARQQGAAKASGTTAPAASSGEKKLSPLELARQQGAAKPKPVEAVPAAAPPESAAAKAAPSPPTAAESKPAGPAAGTPKSTAEILALARKQGAKKG